MNQDPCKSNELTSDSIEISYYFDELPNANDSAMHGTSLIHTSVHVDLLRVVRSTSRSRSMNSTGSTGTVVPRVPGSKVQL